jgi:hypothetical protein
VVTVSLHVGEKSLPLGTSNLVKSLFSTIYVRLEGGDWGARYPVVMGELYGGRLSAARIDEARRELARIRAGLSMLSPREVVWDYEHSEASPPWGVDVAPTVSNLAEYYWTSDGRNLLDVLEEAFRLSAERDEDVVIA